ncbi:MAG: sigma-54 dependent transcriptional regulator [Desulfovibrionaceae bacterium]
MALILVVDDEESIRFTFKAFLEAQGHEVRTAATHDAALAALDAAAPDLVFADILLGGLTGIDVLGAVNARGLHSPVVIITGEPSVDTAAQAVKLGAYEYAIKPIDRDHLLRITHGALRHKRLGDEKRAVEAEREFLRLHLEALFNSVPDGIVIVDANMRILRANGSMRDVLGLDPAKIVGAACRDAFAGECGAAFCKVIDQVLRTHTSVREYQVECLSASNAAKTCMVACFPLADGAGGHLGVVLSVRDITRLAGLERELEEKRHFRNIVGKSRPMQDMYQLLTDLADTDTTVLVTGASGTGKELVAEALHAGGARGRGPLVKVNCSALSENLLESELFGHVRGAFTGAVRDKVGRFQLAHGGTIFLDEIGDISSRIQVKLLRVLQEKEFERVGDSRTMKVDVRLVAATNQDLREKVAQGAFREDLYYRLKVVEVAMTPLAGRREDIPLLVDHFLAQFNKQFNKKIVGLDECAMAAMMTNPWPGNIRELKHAMEHAFILCRGPVIQCAHLPLEVRASKPTPGETVAQPRLSRASLEQALTLAGGNKAKAARQLGISRQTIYRKMLEYGIA